MASTTRRKDTRNQQMREAPMNKGILLITVILLFPVPAMSALSQAHTAYELRQYTTSAQEAWPLRSDLERAVDSCTHTVHRHHPDFDAYSEGSSVILFGATPESRFEFHTCMSKKGYPLTKTRQ